MKIAPTKTICLAFENEEHYKECLLNKSVYKDFLENYYQNHPELFPTGFNQGFNFKGYIHSKKQSGFRTQRICLKSNGQIYQIRPSFMLPYMVAKIEDIEKAIYLTRFGVPFYALAYVFGFDHMYWYRIYCSFGRASIVGSTVKKAELLPKHLLADEKHSRLKSQKVYLPTTVANGCFLGVDLVQSAGTEALKNGYEQFKNEAKNLDPSYQPESVNTDGWKPTKKAWKKLFPTITFIACFLHAFLKIKERCKRHKKVFNLIREKVWNTYHAPTLASFAQRIRRLREWGKIHLTIEIAQEKLLDLCNRADDFKVAYNLSSAYRTSANLDRLMNYQDRVLYSMQYFHGNLNSAKIAARSMALIWNFHIYCPNLTRKHPERHSPFADLNGFVYHQNCLHNMYIATSLGGFRC